MSSALIGCFTVPLISKKETKGENYIFLAVISSGNYTVLIREALKLLLNDQSIAL